MTARRHIVGAGAAGVAAERDRLREIAEFGALILLDDPFRTLAERFKKLFQRARRNGWTAADLAVRLLKSWPPDELHPRRQS